MPSNLPVHGVLIIDDALTVDDLDRCAPRVLFETQRLGPGAARDGLPERREHAHTDDPAIASLLWQRLSPLLAPAPAWFEPARAPRLEPPVEEWSFSGCNQRIRYYRYGLGDRFAPHFDEPFRLGQSARTLLTVLVYLPTAHECVGGETVIEGTVVPVKAGRVVVFDHRRMHEGRPIESGEKLVLRSDVIASVDHEGGAQATAS